MTLSPDTHIKTLGANQTHEIIVRDANKKQYRQSVFSIEMNPSNRVLNLELFSNRGSGSIKTKIDRSEISQTWQSGSVYLLGDLEIGRGDSHGSKGNRRTIEPLKLRVLWECNFWCRFLPTKMLQNEGAIRWFSWCQEIWFQNPPVLTSSSWSPGPPPQENHIRHPVGALKSCPGAFARTWGNIFPYIYTYIYICIYIHMCIYLCIYICIYILYILYIYYIYCIYVYLLYMYVYA